VLLSRFCRYLFVISRFNLKRTCDVILEGSRTCLMSCEQHVRFGFILVGVYDFRNVVEYETDRPKCLSFSRARSPSTAGPHQYQIFTPVQIYVSR
jgi:hypothetical protein